MNFLSTICSDVGIKKQTNQDSACIKIANTSKGKILMAVLCDGMGGLSKGELASATVIKEFSCWFDTQLVKYIRDENTDKIKYCWERMIHDLNQRIAEYGKENGFNLGTTLTALLILDKNYVLIGHIGDTRAYVIDSSITQLTEDHTVVGREIRRGNMTPEQAENDPRRNVLLQCIGASKTVEPQFIETTTNPGNVWILCSDGFRHKLSDKEIMDAFSPVRLNDKQSIDSVSRRMVDINKQRQEEDNITVIAIKLIDEV